MKAHYFIALAAFWLIGLSANAQEPDPCSLYLPDYLTGVSDPVSAGDGFDPGRCTCNGIPLYGNVKIVTDFADFKVKIVEKFPDIRVKTVHEFPDRCGEWKFVDDFPDFTISYVTDFPDFKVKFVDSFPGI